LSATRHGIDGVEKPTAAGYHDMSVTDIMVTRNHRFINDTNCMFDRERSWYDIIMGVDVLTVVHGDGGDGDGDDDATVEVMLKAERAGRRAWCVSSECECLISPPNPSHLVLSRQKLSCPRPFPAKSFLPGGAIFPPYLLPMNNATNKSTSNRTSMPDAHNKYQSIQYG